MTAGRNDEILTRWNLEKILTNRVRGIDSNPHTMRKTFGYKYYRQFRDIPTLMKILNHSSQAVTIRYIGLEEEEIRTSLDKFNPLD